MYIASNQTAALVHPPAALPALQDDGFDFVNGEFDPLITQIGRNKYPDPSGGPFYSGIDPICNRYYIDGTTWVRRADPLILDLDNDGIELSASSSAVLFDHNADGPKTGTQWAKADDGMLVRDLNGNGSIDSGRELFGDQTLLPSGQQAYNGGFEALRPLDSDANNLADGIINAADTAYASLQIWRDLNQDGISQEGELQTLANAGVTAINLNANLQGKSTFTKTVAGVDDQGNPVSISTSQTVQNVNFTQNGFYREYSDQAAWLAQQVMASKTRQGCHVSLFDQRVARCQIRKNARFLRKKVRCNGVIDQF